MTAKDDQIAKLESGYERFREPIAGLPEEAYSEAWLGEWNLDQVLAHMAGWYREMAGAIDRVRNGERPAPPGVDYSDTESFNQRFSAQALHGHEALRDWDDAFEQYVTAARALDESLYGVDPEKGRPRIGDRLLEAAGIGHFAEHQPALDAWLAARSN